MISPPFGLRLMSLVGTSVLNLAAEDPKLLGKKALERIRQTGIGSKLPILRTASFDYAYTSAVSRLFSEGSFRELAELNLVGYRGSDRHKIRRAAERLEQLEQLIPQVEALDSLPSKLNVLFYLTNSLPHTRSGYTFRSHSILQALSDSGVTVSALTRLGYPVLVGRLPKSHVETVDGISYARLLPFNYPSSLKDRLQTSIDEVVRRAEVVNAKILHTTTDFNNALVVSAAAQRLGIPWVYEVRGELESTWLSRQPVDRQEDLKHSDFYKMARVQETAVMNAANAVVALSEVSAQQLIERGVNAEKITVIPNAVSEKEIGRAFSQSAIRKELDLPSGPIVGTVSSLVSYEGLDDLIRAAALVPDLTILIVGDGESRPSLEKLAVEFGIDERVIFTGRKNNDSIWKWYAALDAFVIPRKDTKVCRTVTPIKGIQAQALGVPIIASDLPALREITGGIARYVPAEDPVELANAIRNELETPQDPQAGIEWARHHTWEVNARKFEKMYTDLFK